MTTVYFDFETGGLEMHHPDISLAAVAMRDGKEIDSFYSLILFDPSKADPEALKINHYDPARWDAEGKPEGIVAKNFSLFLSKHKSLTLTSARTGKPYNVARLAGYNSASFDGPRLGAMFNRYDIFPPFRRPTLDILQLGLEYVDSNGLNLPNNKLSTIAGHFGINADDAHDALADCRMTAAIHAAITGKKC